MTMVVKSFNSFKVWPKTLVSVMIQDKGTRRTTWGNLCQEFCEEIIGNWSTTNYQSHLDVIWPLAANTSDTHSRSLIATDERNTIFLLKSHTLYPLCFFSGCYSNCSCGISWRVPIPKSLGDSDRASNKAIISRNWGLPRAAPVSPLAMIKPQ